MREQKEEGAQNTYLAAGDGQVPGAEEGAPPESGDGSANPDLARVSEAQRGRVARNVVGGLF